MAGDPRTALLQLLRRDAVLRGEFVLSSGQKSTYYIDARRVALSAEGSGLVGLVLLEHLSNLDIDAVAGPTLGADPLVTSVAVVSGQLRHPIQGLIVRKAAKAHGAGRRIEGPWQAGMRVVVLEDTVTTGTSVLDAARAVEDEGGTVQAIWCLIDRHQGGREAIEAAGYQFESVYSERELLGS